MLPMTKIARGFIARSYIYVNREICERAEAIDGRPHC
jgi:hypothetical protein